MKIYKGVGVLFVVMAALWCLSACLSTAYGDREMAEAQQLMESRPDSAYSILQSIDRTQLKRESRQARYALLMSAALDKNYIDTTSFNILQPAIDYYLKKGTADEKLKTYYYQGVIHLNRGDSEKALESFTFGMDVSDESNDSLYIGRTLVAQGIMYDQFFDFQQSLTNYLKAADLYESVSRKDLQFDCLLKALNESVVASDKTKADSIYQICEAIAIEDNTQSEEWYSQKMSYLSEFGTLQSLKEHIYEKDVARVNDANTILELALAYHRLNENEKAYEVLTYLKTSGYKYDTLRYQAISVSVLEKLDNYREAYLMYRSFSQTHDSINKMKIDRKSRSMDEKHRLELIAQQESAHKLLAIRTSIGCILLLVFVTTTLILLFKNQQNKLKLAEQNDQLHKQINLKLKAENKNFELEHNNKKLEAEKLAEQNKMLKIEKDKKALEAERLYQENRILQLEKDNQALKAEKLKQLNSALKLENDQNVLKSENLAHRISELENERESLKKLLNAPRELPKEIQDAVKIRIEMLNDIMAHHISGNKKYSQPYETWVKELTNNKDEFMESNLLAFKASHPQFIHHLEKHGLSTYEMKYVCLYGLGLRSKEVGLYIDKAGHINTSSIIRKKLGLDRHSTNLGIYIRKLMKGDIKPPSYMSDDLSKKI